MQKLTITIALAVIALALGTTTITTTTMQIQPAYSQATHCVDKIPRGITCITPGKDPSKTSCERGSTTVGGFMCGTTGVTHQEAGQEIMQQHRDCAQGIATGCIVTSQSIIP